MNIFKSTALLFVSLLCFSACENGGGGNLDPEPEQPKQTTITLNKTEAFVKVDGQVVLTATVEPESKITELQWTSSDDTVASVDNGIVTANKLGTATVIAFIDNVIASCKINVVETSAEKITLDKTEISISVGDTEQISATVEPEDAENQNIDWYSEDETVATVKEGLVTALKAGKTNIVARIGHVESKCAVTVTNIPVIGISIEPSTVEISENETVMLTVTITPANATDKTLDWATDDPEIATVAQVDGMENMCVVSGMGEGKTVITAFAADGEISASCEVTVKKSETPQAAPKVGDYYYSDGTWSDGGLISMDLDGTNAVWAENKPAPVAGKTVIGIVFQTDPDRIASSEKERGFTHGYVVAAKCAHFDNYETTFYSLQGVDCISPCKVGSTWYKNLDGWSDTNTVLMEYSSIIYQFHVFDLIRDFTPTAPAKSSGWFLPSTGQMWDMVANLCGNEVAQFLKENRTNGYDATYYVSTHVSYDALDAFNEKFSLIPENQREDLKVDDTYTGSCMIWTSSVYTPGEAVCTFSIGNRESRDGKEGSLVECSLDWMDSMHYARYILAF